MATYKNVERITAYASFRSLNTIFLFYNLIYDDSKMKQYPKSAILVPKSVVVGVSYIFE